MAAPGLDITGDENNVVPHPPPPLKIIWECPMMFRFVNNTTGKWQMKCTHCGMVAASNATKLVYHAAQIRGGNIRICTSIPSDLYKENTIPYSSR